MGVRILIKDTMFFLHKVGGHDISFEISDEDTAGDPLYYGYLASNGSWIIMENNTTNGTYRYAVGSEDYTANWTARAGLTYKYFNQLTPGG